MSICGQRTREVELRALVAEYCLAEKRPGHNEVGEEVTVGPVVIERCVACGCVTIGVQLPAPVRCGMSGCEGPT